MEATEEAPVTEESDAVGEETILLVEDEAALRTATCEFLETKGYRVLLAANAAEALRISTTHNDEIDMLMTDLVMPGLGGLELAEKLVEMRPGIRVVYMSGYTEQTARPEAFQKPRFYIQKPFSLPALSAIARRALRAGESDELSERGEGASEAAPRATPASRQRVGLGAAWVE